ncbi:MAG: hypothetical protein ACREHD_06070, partial [Pirellulales bacterium]
KAQPVPGQIPTYSYNFPTVYGQQGGFPLTNVITAPQMALTREIFQLWSNYLGVQFKETSDETLGAADFGIVTGVVQSVLPTAPATLDAVAGPAQTSPNTANGVPEFLAVMNDQVFSTESAYGGPWFTAAMQQIGRLLGLGYDGEGPPGTVMGLGGNDPATGAAPEPVFPSNTDILHGQSLYQPASDNVDMYKFTINTAGTLNAETIAQRSTFNSITLPSTSAGLLATTLDGTTFTINDGTHTVTFELDADGRSLAPGDKNTPVNYKSTDTAAVVAADIAGAINAAAAARGLNANASTEGSTVNVAGPGTVTGLSNTQDGVTYSNQSPASSAITVPATSAGPVGTGFDGSAFTMSDGTHSVTFEFDANGRALATGDTNTPIAYNSTDTAATVAGDIVTAINAAAASANLSVSAAASGNQVVLTSTSGAVSVTPSAPQGGIAYANQPSGLNTVLTLYSQTNLIQVPTTVGAGLDGSTFTLNDGIHAPVTFEFAENGRTLTDGNTPIAYNSGDNANVIASDIAKAVNAASASTGLNASASVQFTQVTLSGPLTVTPAGNQGGVTYTLSRQIIARNDDYFGNDSFVGMHLVPGVYYIAVTSTGNTQFDPNVPGSGSGGTTQGPYSLQLDFTHDPATLTDAGLSLQVTAAGAAAISDGDSFTVQDVGAGGQALTQTFVFYKTTSAPANPPAGQVSITIAKNASQDQV